MQAPLTEDHPRAPARAATTGAGLSPLTQSKLFFFAAAGLSFLLSVYLFFSGDHERGIYVGIWVPSILSAGGLLLSGARHE
jgi:hypothetical protein